MTYYLIIMLAKRTNFKGSIQRVEPVFICSALVVAAGVILSSNSSYLKTILPETLHGKLSFTDHLSSHLLTCVHDLPAEGFVWCGMHTLQLKVGHTSFFLATSYDGRAS